MARSPAETTDPELGSSESSSGLSGLLLEVRALLGSVTSRMDRDLLAAPRIPWNGTHPVSFQGVIPISGGAGTVNLADMYGPKDPYWWDLRTLDVWGFTAGTFTLTKNSPTGTGGLQLAQTTVPGEFTWGSQHLLAPRDWLVFNATGITGTVQFYGEAIEVETAWLPEYLM